MAAVLAKMKGYYDYVFYDLCDHRSRDMFPSPELILTVIPLYIYFSVKLGPQLMKDLKPFKLKTPILIYNIIQIILSAYIFIQGLLGGWLTEYSWTCQPVDMTENYYSRKMLNAFWWYTVVKLVDLMDTVFFVLRKKDRQISFLHVFHHSLMPLASFIGIKYFPNGHATLLGLINSLVHVVMYTYYLVSGLGPQYQKYLWWKKHLTTMQLVQFFIIFVHNLIPLFGECSYPKWISFLLCIHSIQFIYLFGSFYYVNYIQNVKKDIRNGSTETIHKKLKMN